jgi:hypothetical protein
LPNRIHDQRRLIKSMAIPIAKKLKPMPLPETMGAPHFRGVEVT